MSQEQFKVAIWKCKASYTCHQKYILKLNKRQTKQNIFQPQPW